jgi:hypothetical protein
MPSRKATVLEGQTFVGSKFHLSAVKKNQAKRETAYLNYGSTKGAVYVRTPILRMPFEPTTTQYKDGVPKGSIALALDGYDKDSTDHDPEVRHFYEQLKAVDEVITAAAVRSSVNMVGKSLAKLAPEAQRKKARAQQFLCVRQSKTNPKTGRPYSPIIKFKFYMSHDGTPEVPARIKREGQPRVAIQPEDILQNLTRNCRVRLTFRFSGLWFKPAGRLKQFGFSNIIESIEIFPYIGPKRVVKQPADFDASAIVTPADVRNSYGSPQVRLGYEKPSQRIAIQSPYGVVMGSREGQGVEFFPDTENKEYFRLEFPDFEDDPEQAAFVKTLLAVEERVQALAIERSEAWFGDQIDDDDGVRDYITPIVRRIGDTKGEVDESVPPYVKLKLPQKGEGDSLTYRAKFKDREGEPIEGMDLIRAAMQRGTRARAVILACPLYIMNEATFGVPFEAMEVQLDTTLAELEDGDADNATAADHLFADDEDGDVVAAAEVAADDGEAEEDAAQQTGSESDEDAASSSADADADVTAVETEEEEDYSEEDEPAHAAAR